MSYTQTDENNVQKIKRLMKETSCGLREAKEAIDQQMGNYENALYVIKAIQSNQTPQKPITYHEEDE